MVGVEQWAEVRRLYFVKGLSIKEIVRRTGHGRNTNRRALRSGEPPRYRRPPRPSKLDPFREEIHRLLREEPRLPGTRVRELVSEQGYDGGKTILDDYLREVRPLFLPRPHTFQRTSYRPGTLLQFRSLGALARDPGRRRPDAPRLRRHRLPSPLARGRGDARLSEEVVVERLQGYLETSFEPGRSFAGELDFQEQLDRWFQERANLRFHRTLRCRPADRLAEELQVMRPLPERMPDTDRRLCTRVPPDPYVRVDTCDYSLDPRLAGRRVELRVS